jgi:predicted transcriptional regulator
MASINKQELMLMGARSRLVELETERIQLLKMFPELDISETPPRKKARQVRKARKQKKVKVQRGKIKPIAMVLLTKHKEVTPQMLADDANIELKRANNILHNLMANGEAKRIGRGIYGRA